MLKYTKKSNKNNNFIKKMASMNKPTEYIPRGGDVNGPKLFRCSWCRLYFNYNEYNFCHCKHDWQRHVCADCYDFRLKKCHGCIEEILRKQKNQQKNN